MHNKTIAQRQCKDTATSLKVTKQIYEIFQTSAYRLTIFAGADCSQRGERGFWESITYKDLLPDGSASHCSIVWKDSLYVVGGESFHRAKMIYVYDYNGNVWETPHVEGKVPLPRYAHSCVLFGDKIFMYGGVVQNSTVTNEIWAFDVSAKVWENVTVHDNCHNKTICGPLKVGNPGSSAAIMLPRRM